MIMIRYGEMTLKKGNYRYFQKQINDNIKRKLKDFPNLKFSSTNYRFYIYLNGTDHVPIIEKLNTIFGFLIQPVRARNPIMMRSRTQPSN